MDSPGLEPDASACLTLRQRQAIIYAATGLTNLEIAERLYVSPRSVERALTEACEVFEVPNRTALALAAYRAGVVKDEHLEAAS